MPSIAFQHVSKRYTLGTGRGSLRDTVPEILTRWVRRDRQPEAAARDLWALCDVSFEVRQGEILGLVGANGAGKSTVLKLLSKVTRPTDGRIAVNGRVSALIELGAGFHPDLTGRENVYLSGGILGLRRTEIDDRMESIVDFAELDEFMDTPVKRYSSGMYVRLGFAVAVHVDPEILLVDEVLAVGDIRFQDKCIKQIDAFRQRGKTMVIVSHSRHMLERLCDRALLLNRGRLVAEGTIGSVMDEYYRARYHGTETLDGATRPADNGSGSRALEITKVVLCDQIGLERSSFVSGERMVVRISFRANSRVTDPVFYSDICQGDLLLNGNNNSCFEIATGSFEAGDEGVAEITYGELNLLNGRYFVRVGVTQDVFTQIKYHVVDKACVFEVSSKIHQGAGLIHLPQWWSVRKDCGTRLGSTSSRVGFSGGE